MELHLTALECHLLYGITQCYLPPDTSEHTPARQARTWFTYPWGMEGWVELGDLLYTAILYLPADGHPSKYWFGSSIAKGRHVANVIHFCAK